jgi:hypothetical protein
VVRTMPFSSSPIGANRKSLNAEVRSENTDCDVAVLIGGTDQEAIVHTFVFQAGVRVPLCHRRPLSSFLRYNKNGHE